MLGADGELDDPSGDINSRIESSFWEELAADERVVRVDILGAASDYFWYIFGTFRWEKRRQRM